MHSGQKILLTILVILCAASTGVLIWSGVVLFKAVSLGRNYILSTCKVSSIADNSLCIKSGTSCYSQNQYIWWYNNWGSSYFIYITGVDKWGYDDAEYDDGGKYSGGEDGDGGFEDGGGGEGGDGGDGGGEGCVSVGIDGEMLRHNRKMDSTSGASDLSNIKEIKNVKKSLYQQYQEYEQLSANDINQYSQLASNNNTSGNSSSSSGECVYNGCLQGVYNVQYSVDGKAVNSTIKGLVSLNGAWVNSYLQRFSVGSSYDCYYSSNEIENVIWFQPPMYKLYALVIFIVSSILFIFFLLMSLLVIKRSRASYRRIN